VKKKEEEGETSASRGIETFHSVAAIRGTTYQGGEGRGLGGVHHQERCRTGKLGRFTRNGGKGNGHKSTIKPVETQGTGGGRGGAGNMAAVMGAVYLDRWGENEGQIIRLVLVGLEGHEWRLGGGNGNQEDVFQGQEDFGGELNTKPDGVVTTVGIQVPPVPLLRERGVRLGGREPSP